MLQFSDRAGWEPKKIVLSTVEGPLAVDALAFGDLAVHRMVKDPGWCFSYAPRGLRISVRYRVFRTREVAMDMVEKIYPLTNDWGSWFDDQIPEHLRAAVADAHDSAPPGTYIDGFEVVPTRRAV